MTPPRRVSALLGALGLGAATFAACYWISASIHSASDQTQTNELAWLGREFQLSAPELERIRVLHQGYRPQCEAMCARIAAKNRELVEHLRSATNVTRAVEQSLTEIGQLRAECQVQMLRHFQAVARLMPPEPGRRYLAEMQRLTLDGPEASPAAA